MSTSRYESKKPSHQQGSKHSQPPLGSVAVFEWETFAPLKDFSDKSMTAVYQRISRDIIERPYHYDRHRAFDAQGREIPYAFKQADNQSPPAKVPGVAVYKQNHGTGHAIRQMIYTDALIDKISTDGSPKGQDVAAKVNANPELKAAMKLAAYCKRIGRSFDHEHDDKGHISVYSQRSADMFAKMATELGFKSDVIAVIQESMLEPMPVTPSTVVANADIGGISGTDLRDFSESILMAAHMADLSRLMTVATRYVERSLMDLFEPAKLKEVTVQLVEMACKANEMTGNAVVKQENIVKHREVAIDGKKLVDVVKNIDRTIDNLSRLPLTPPAPGSVQKINQLLNVAPIAPAVDKVQEKQREAITFLKDIASTVFKISPANLETMIDEKTSEPILIMTFPNPKEALLMSKRLMQMGVESRAKPGLAKLVHEGNRVMLTEKDALLIQKYQQAIQSDIKTLQTELAVQNIAPSVDKTNGQTHYILTLNSSREAVQMVTQLYNMGVKSLSKGDVPKTIQEGNTIVLTKFDIAQISKQFNAISHEREMIHAFTQGEATVVPSINNKNGATNIQVVFKTAEAAKDFTQKLADEGVMSRSNPGQPKSVQGGTSVILTQNDCKDLEQSLSQKNQMKLG